MTDRAISTRLVDKPTPLWAINSNKYTRSNPRCTWWARSSSSNRPIITILPTASGVALTMASWRVWRSLWVTIKSTVRLPLWCHIRRTCLRKRGSRRRPRRSARSRCQIRLFTLRPIKMITAPLTIMMVAYPCFKMWISSPESTLIRICKAQWLLRLLNKREQVTILSSLNSWRTLGSKICSSQEFNTLLDSRRKHLEMVSMGCIIHIMADSASRRWPRNRAWMAQAPSSWLTLTSLRMQGWSRGRPRRA